MGRFIRLGGDHYLNDWRKPPPQIRELNMRLVYVSQRVPEFMIIRHLFIVNFLLPVCRHLNLPTKERMLDKRKWYLCLVIIAALVVSGPAMLKYTALSSIEIDGYKGTYFAGNNTRGTNFGDKVGWALSKLRHLTLSGLMDDVLPKTATR